MEESEAKMEEYTMHECKNGEVAVNVTTASLSNGVTMSELDSIFRGSELAGSDEDEVPEVTAFIMEQEMDAGTKDLTSSKFLLTHEVLHTSLAGVDPVTQARLEALLEAAGIGELPTADGKGLSDPDMLRKLTSSVSCALDEAAAALTRMRSEHCPNSVDRSLAEACGDGDVGAVRRLLNEGRSVNETNDDGRSLLSLACSSGYYELAEVLLAMRANVEDRGVKGDRTPLMEAASGGYADITRLLIAHGADVNAQSTEGNTTLHYAACSGHEDVVSALIESGAGVEEQNENGHTPLMEAASAGHVGVARMLLGRGAGINTHSTEFKESALTLACYKGHLEMAKFLLEAGADQEHKTDEMHTALMEASMDGHVEVARLLLDSGAQVNMPADSFESPLTLAACGGHVELANLLIERNASLEEVNDEGYTPLMEAAREGHEEMVALLLAHGAYINAQTEETQETALTLACCGGFLEVADFLLKAGADIELGCSTPLMEASQEGHYDLVRHLVSAGANIHAQTGTGDTALTYACENGHTDIAELLLQAGAELEHESEGGRTPLMKAARAGHLCTVQFLVSRGANVNRSTTSNDHTVLSLACAGGHLNVVELLLGHRADPTHKLKDGSTMLIEAARGGHTNVVTLLLDFPNVKTTSRPLENNIPISYDTPDLANIGDDVNALDQETLASRLEQFISKMMAQADGVDTGSCSDLEEQQMQLAKKQEILNELQRVEHELRGRRNAVPSSNAGVTAARGDAAIVDTSLAVVAAASGYSGGAQRQQWQQIVEQQQLNEHQLLQQKEYYQCKLQQLKQQYQQKQLQLQQKQLQLIEQAKGAPLLSVAGGGLASVLPPPPPSPASPGACSPQQAPGSGTSPSRRPPVPLHIALQSHLHAHHVAEGNVSSLAQALQDWDNRDRNVIYPADVKPMPTFFSSPRQGDEDEGVEAASVLPLHGSELIGDEGVPPQRSLARALAALIHGQNDDTAVAMHSSAYVDQAEDEQIARWSSLLPNESELVLVERSEREDRGVHRFADSSIQQMEFPDDDDDDQVQQLNILSQLQRLNLTGNRCAEVVASVPTTITHQSARDVCVQQRSVTLDVATSRVLSASTLPPSRSAPSSPPPCIPLVDPNAATESNHDTALTLACAGGHAELVHLLLTRQADIEHKDKKGFTPLILAATAGHADVVEILLEQAAEIEAQSERTKDTALSLACSGGRYEVVELLLRRGANKEHRNVSDYTPLSLAASGGYVNIIKLLLNYGAEINSRTGSKLGISPLMLAAMNGHTAGVKVLLDMGSDINAQIETNRNTALTLACFQGRHEVVSLLVDRKANIEHRAKTGLTPLMEAASGGYVEVGRVLLDKGADVNAAPVPSSRDTALTIAADKGHYRFVELLLSHGAAVDVKNKKGNSPLWLASNGGHLDVIQLLFGAGADIDSQDNRRVTCLMAAFRKGHLKVVKWLVRHVSQFPSDKECGRYISTATDKELLKKCQQCMDVIVAAKDRQAAEANKNATSLLEEIETEKSQEEKRREAAARKREKKKQKRKEKQQQLIEKHVSGPLSEDDDDDEDEVEPDAIVVPSSERQLIGHERRDSGTRLALSNGNSSDVCQRRSNLTKENKENANIRDQISTENTSKKAMQHIGILEAVCHTADSSRIIVPLLCNDYGGGGEAVDGSAGRKLSAPTTRGASDNSDSNSSMTRSKNKKNRRQQSKENDSAAPRTLGNHSAPAALASGGKSSSALTCDFAVALDTTTSGRSLSSNNNAPSSNSSLSSRSIESVAPNSSQLVASAAQRSTVVTASSSQLASGKKARLEPAGGSSGTNSSSCISGTAAESDDCGTSSSNSSATQKNTRQCRPEEPGRGNHPDIFDKKSFHSASPNKGAAPGIKPVVSPSPKKGKRDEGWKEVVRKSKKISVPAAAASRVLGRATLAAVREWSGASVDVDTLDATAGGERSLTIKGSADATRNAHSLLTTLIQNPERDLEDLLGKKKLRGHPSSHGEQCEDAMASIGTFRIADFIVTCQGCSASVDSRPKYSTAVMAGSVSSPSTTAIGDGAVKQVRPPPLAKSAVAAATQPTPRPATTTTPFAPVCVPSPASSPQPSVAIAPRLLARAPHDISRQLFPESRERSASPQQPGHATAGMGGTASIQSGSPLLASAPKPGTQFAGLLTKSASPGILPVAATQATGFATLPEGGFAPFDSSLLKNSLASKANLSFSSAATMSMVKQEADPAKAPGFRPPSSVSQHVSSRDASSVAAASSRSAPSGIPRSGGGLPSSLDGAGNSSALVFPLGMASFPFSLPVQYSSYTGAGVPMNHFLDGMHSGFKSPSVLSPRSAFASRNEYTTANQPMTLPKISSSLNPNASEFKATHGGQSDRSDMYQSEQALTASAAFHAQPMPFAESPSYFGSIFHPSMQPIGVSLEARSAAIAASAAGSMHTSGLPAQMPLPLPAVYSPVSGRLRVPVHAQAAPETPAGPPGMRPASGGSGNESGSSPSPPTPSSSASPRDRSMDDRQPMAATGSRTVGAIGGERLQKKQQLQPNAGFGGTLAVGSDRSQLGSQLPSPPNCVAAPVGSIWSFPNLGQDWATPVISSHNMVVPSLIPTMLSAPPHAYGENSHSDQSFKVVDGMTPAGFPSYGMYQNPAEMIGKSWSSPAKLRPAATGSRNMSQESEWTWTNQSTAPNS